MTEEMKKYMEYIKIAAFFIPLVYGIFTYTNSFVNVPDEVKELKSEVALLKEKNRRQDSVDVVHTLFLKQDYDALVKSGIMP